MSDRTSAQHAEIVINVLLSFLFAVGVVVLLYALAGAVDPVSHGVAVLGIRAAAFVVAGVRQPALIPESWFARELLDDTRFDYDSFSDCDLCQRGLDNNHHSPAMHAESVMQARAEAMG